MFLVPLRNQYYHPCAPPYPDIRRPRFNHPEVRLPYNDCLHISSKRRHYFIDRTSTSRSLHAERNNNKVKITYSTCSQRYKARQPSGSIYHRLQGRKGYEKAKKGNAYRVCRVRRYTLPQRIGTSTQNRTQGTDKRSSMDEATNQKLNLQLQYTYIYVLRKVRLYGAK